MLIHFSLGGLKGICPVMAYKLVRAFDIQYFVYSPFFGLYFFATATETQTRVQAVFLLYHVHNLTNYAITITQKNLGVVCEIKNGLCCDHFLFFFRESLRSSDADVISAGKQFAWYS